MVSAFLLSSSSSHFVGGERATDLHAGESVLPRGIVAQECSFPGICDLCTIGDLGNGIWDLGFEIFISQFAFELNDLPHNCVSYLQSSGSRLKQRSSLLYVFGLLRSTSDRVAPIDEPLIIALRV